MAADVPEQWDDDFGLLFALPPTAQQAVPVIIAWNEYLDIAHGVVLWEYALC